jgi:hypothetical protein
MSEQPASQLIIRGVPSSGQTFRPSDWAERLAGILSTFGLDSRINYSPYVHPLSCDRLKCLVVDAKLEQIDSRAWGFLMGFAHDNNLVVESFSRQ